MHYIKGSLNSVADHFSRYINNITVALPGSKDLIEMQRNDPVQSHIIQKIHQNDVSPQVSNYFIDGDVFRSELLAIKSRLQFECETEVQFQDVWILTGSRASVQHLANWIFIGYHTTLDIFNVLDMISSDYRVYLQAIPPQMGIDDNDKVDFLARTAAQEGSAPTESLTFSKLSFRKNIYLNHFGTTPPTRP
ncbi:hypothetical protein TNCV_3696111 [Trichonephila clavipes]|nr:hypothetical protein TNCV_3696111 [Trichonephila clavipes]